MHSWSFLTNHARALLYVAANDDARLRDLAAALEVTERTAYGIVADLTEAGYVVKQKEGRRNRYEILEDVALPVLEGVQPTVGDLLALLGTAERRADNGEPERRAPRNRRSS